ncbi:MFS transporter [Candidatus Lucifugimonas marina]|uniref:MFS transporter n=1 Tax=Candidatus Lucifugimonas marina TaxID=3038979 RepID=A0AAJ6CSE7_9CHLR|nr:MFS transporter [SAR202 cluster bacterium JH702]MDG0868603.1 MFS transporter [SAR202 cluster bacterium JH639]WFG35238.1 MFS transporter [SAR202 cluster bacterium JH545]WFG39188.1 MFS transporter [SAR202 cluster bacterium JH1073]
MSLPFIGHIYRGYPIALVVFLSTGLSVGMAQYAFGEFAGPLKEQFGWSQTELNYSLVFSFISGLLAPYIGNLSDRIGIRPVMFFSLLLIATGFLLRPFITELWHWYLFSSLVYAGFPGATIMPAGKMVGLWFPKTRGRVMGAVVAGNNFGGVTMPPLAAAIIAALSWEMAYVTFGMIMAALGVVALFVIVEDENKIETEMNQTGRADQAHVARAAARAGLTVKQALRNRNFWLVMIGLVAATFTYQGVLTQLRQHFEESGFAPAVATTAVSIIAGMGIFSKLAFGRASEKITARVATIISVSLQAAGVFIIASADATPLLWVGIFVFGTGFGGLGALIVLVVQEAFGMKEFGGIMGLMQVGMIASSAGAPYMAGKIHDATESFDVSFFVIVAIFLLGIVALALARPLDAEELEAQTTEPGG